jgi:predicted amidohydrolase
MSCVDKSMLDSILKYLGKSMLRKSNPAAIRRYLSQKGMRRSANLDAIDPRAIRVAMVQEQVRVLKTYRAYADRMEAFVARAAGLGAQLVCFPEDNGLLLLGQFPFIDLILRYASRQIMAAGTGQAVAPEVSSENVTLPVNAPEMVSASPSNQPGGLDIPHLVSFFTPFFKAAFETTFSELAKGYGVYIMAGSAMLVADGKLFNRAYLFGPQGELIGTQDKVHPTEMEIDAGVAFGDELKVFETSLGRLAFPVCMDATYFETFKILKRLGAQMIIIPIFNMEAFEYYFTLRGIWPRVQESGVYGLKSAMVGDLYALKLTGQAGAYAPLELTGDRSGVLAEAESFDRDDLIIADLDLTRLETYRSDYFSDSNPPLYRKYFPEVYD